LPALATGVVAWAVLGGGEPRRVEFARVLGGPTRAGATSSVLVGVWALDEQRTVPIAGMGLRLVARGDVLASGTSDASGHLEATLALTGPAPYELRVERTSDGAVLAEGPIDLGLERWLATARRDGGWLRGSTRGELGLDLAVVEGVLAVPFEGRLFARVRAAADESAPPVAGATLELELVGAELTEPMRATNEAGGAEIALRPLEHGVSARLRARSGARQGEWYGVLPVVPGALTARIEGTSLRVSSPIPRERAFVSLISANARLGGAVVELEASPAGIASGRFDPSPQLLGRLEREATWAVVSSEDDKRSPAVVGWPLGAALASIPATTFAVADQVLLDGQAGALRARAARSRTRRDTAAALLGALAVLTGGLFWLEVRARGRRMAPLQKAGDGWFLAAALACIALGLGALAYFGALER
jgi:hypothetical protein